MKEEKLVPWGLCIDSRVVQKGQLYYNWWRKISDDWVKNHLLTLWIERIIHINIPPQTWAGIVKQPSEPKVVVSAMAQYAASVLNWVPDLPFATPTNEILQEKKKSIPISRHIMCLITYSTSNRICLQLWMRIEWTMLVTKESAFDISQNMEDCSNMYRTIYNIYWLTRWTAYQISGR